MAKIPDATRAEVILALWYLRASGIALYKGGRWFYDNEEPWRRKPVRGAMLTLGERPVAVSGRLW
jgi:hypothetical protein